MKGTCVRLTSCVRGCLFHSLFPVSDGMCWALPVHTCFPVSFCPCDQQNSMDSLLPTASSQSLSSVHSGWSLFPQFLEMALSSSPMPPLVKAGHWFCLYLTLPVTHQGTCRPLLPLETAHGPRFLHSRYIVTFGAFKCQRIQSSGLSACLFSIFFPSPAPRL